MKYYIMTLVSIVVVLAIKSYTINAQDKPVNDSQVELMASGDLLNQADTVRHQKMINRFLSKLETSEKLNERYTGAANFPNQVFENYERIERVGTKEELNELLLHESPIVRIYAHRALAANQMEMDKVAMELLVNDTTLVFQHDGAHLIPVRVMDLASAYLFHTDTIQ